MRHLVACLVLLLVSSCASAPAFARPHHSRDTERHLPLSYDHQATGIAPLSVERTGTPSRARRHASRGSRYVRVAHSTYSRGSGRPADCFGIAWCGCWLRHQFGMADKALNLARNWAKVGSAASPDDANVAVWGHHVGRVLARRPGEILLQSGNDGHAVRTRWRSTRGVIAFRRV